MIVFDMRGDTWFLAKGWQYDAECATVVAKRIRTLMSHFFREKASSSTHPEWYVEVDNIVQQLVGNVVEPVVAAPKRPPRSKAAPKEKAKAKAKSKPKAKSKSSSPSFVDAARVVRPADATLADAAHVVQQPPAEATLADEPPQKLPRLVRSKAAPPSQCVQIPASRFDIWSDSSDSEEGEGDESSATQPITPTEPDSDHPESTDSANPTFLESAPKTPAASIIRNVASPARSPTPIPDDDQMSGANEQTQKADAHKMADVTKLPIAFPKPEEIQTGFSNRKGAWIRFLTDEVPKVKYFTTTIEDHNSEAWGIWSFQTREVRAVVTGLQVSEIGLALGGLCSKYVRGQKQGCTQRPPVYKGFSFHIENIHAFALATVPTYPKHTLF